MSNYLIDSFLSCIQKGWKELTLKARKNVALFSAQKVIKSGIQHDLQFWNFHFDEFVGKCLGGPMALSELQKEPAVGLFDFSDGSCDTRSILGEQCRPQVRDRLLNRLDQADKLCVSGQGV
jgi:hypothetical protein